MSLPPPELPEWARLGRARWRWTGAERPDFAGDPGPGRESVWDYPRPPRIEAEARRVRVAFGDVVIVESTRALRVLETASPPSYYIPAQDVAGEGLAHADGRSLCEWKGEASYFDVVVDGHRAERAAWSYAAPFPGFEAIRGHFAFYPDPLVCSVGELTVRRQPGRFYGGWVTEDLVGPFKGEPDSEDW